MQRIPVYYIFSIILFSALSACKSNAELKQIGVKDISWLVGQWQTEPRNRVEVWSLRGDKYQASGLLLNENKPLVNELMNISEVNGFLVYSVLAYGQNDNKYIDFTLSNRKPKDLLFSNPDHDFPKTIRYTLENENQLKVTIGDENKEQSITFYRSK